MLKSKINSGLLGLGGINLSRKIIYKYVFFCHYEAHLFRILEHYDTVDLFSLINENLIRVQRKLWDLFAHILCHTLNSGYFLG